MLDSVVTTGFKLGKSSFKDHIDTQDKADFVLMSNHDTTVINCADSSGKNADRGQLALGGLGAAK